MNISNNIQFNSTSKASPATGKQKDWTVLLYMNGNNDIEGDILKGFLTTEETAQHDKINMLAQLGRAPQYVAHPTYKDEIDGDWGGVRRYVMKKGENGDNPREVWTSLGKHDAEIDSEITADLGKADMSSPDTLQDFLEWGMKKYPAKHYMVVLAGHGAGFLGALPDYKSKKHMSLREISDTFEEVQKNTEIKPDIVVMDACLMAQGEAAVELQNTGKYYIASEDYNYNCLPMQKTLMEVEKRMDQGKDITPEEMAGILVEQSGKFRDVPTISSINMEKMTQFIPAVKDLADKLLNTNTNPDTIRDIIKSTRGFAENDNNVKPYSDYKDLKDLALRIAGSKNIKDPDLKKSASHMADVMNSGLITDEAHAKELDEDGRGEISGLTVYIPTGGFDYDDYNFIFPGNTNKSEYEGIYRSLEFTRKTGWDKVIDKYAESAKKKSRREDVLNKLIFD
ncbi:MAG: hypothetical protein K8T10_09940 [Candidatus Eremiobacteraeota bacterium]|nr:hypothetical protein [Candidatus Eremiobacteraeota bacterium]